VPVGAGAVSVLFEEKGRERFVEILLRSRETAGTISVADSGLDNARRAESGQELVARQIPEKVGTHPTELRLVLEKPFAGEEREQGITDPTQVADRS
jgi:hypothetical protein